MSIADLLHCTHLKLLTTDLVMLFKNVFKIICGDLTRHEHYSRSTHVYPKDSTQSKARHQKLALN